MENTIKKSLGESIDILRKDVSLLSDDIMELYDLDSDNYKAIKAIRSALLKVDDKVNSLARRCRKHTGKTVLAFFGVGVVGYFGITGLKALTERVNKMQNELDKLKDETKAEESDG